jgi:hypothetical protein
LVHAARGCLQHAADWVPLARVAQREIDVEHGVALVAAEPLGPCGMDAALHTGARRATLEAVAAQDLGVEAGPGGAGPDDPGDGPGIDRLGGQNERNALLVRVRR